MIENIYIETLLSAAAYARWDKSESSIKDELISNRGYTEGQYNNLFDQKTGLFEVYQGSSIGYSENGDGFSATIFKNRISGKLTVSFRGTNNASDFIMANFLLAVGVSSIADLFGVGHVSNIEKLFIDAGLADTAGNLLVDPNTVDFVGHSLGGHLATMAAYKYPGMVNRVSTFNGAGLVGLDEIWNTHIAGSVSGGQLDKSRVTNYYADKGVEVTADQDLWFDRPGGRHKIFVEENSALENHSISNLVKSISVYRLLALLDGNLDSPFGVDSIYKILDSASNVPDQSLATTIQQLAELLGNSLPHHTDDIENLHQYLLSSTGELKPEYQGLHITPISNAEASQEQANQNTATGLAYRYALLNLNTFAVIGNATLYAQHNSDHKLDLEQFSHQYLTDRSALLERKIWFNEQDKLTINPQISPNNSAHLFEYEPKYFKDFTSGYTIQQGGIFDNTHRYLFGDQTINTTDIGGSFIGSGVEDGLYGGSGKDTLKGGFGNDHLEGGKGDDTYLFNTGDGTDTLLDTQGINKIVIDGVEIRKLNRIAPGSHIYQAFDGTGSPLEKTTFTDTSGTMMINIGGLGTGDRIDIINWDPGNFTLTLGDALPPTRPALSAALHVVGSGNYLGNDFEGNPENKFLARPKDDRIAGTSYEYNAALYLANDATADIDYPWLNPNDHSKGSYAFRFEGGENNDSLKGSKHNTTSYPANDWLDGQDGDDLLYGEADPLQAEGDNDLLIGGRGNDQIFGGAGNDTLVGWNDQLIPFQGSNYLPNPTLHDEFENTNDKDYIVGGIGEDVLIAGRGNDTLVGGAGHDFIMGNLGADRISGGSGDDYITADAYAKSFITSSVTGNDIYIAPDLNVDFSSGHNNDDLIDAGNGKDTIHGGAGNDLIYAGEGSDIIYGDQLNEKMVHRLSIEGVAEPTANLTARYADLDSNYHGDDLLYGGGENDYIFGNGGNDELHGDSGHDDLYGDDFTLPSDQHGNDYLSGGEGEDKLYGGGGSDTLYGGNNRDLLYGDNGPKQITGYVNGIPIYADIPLYSFLDHNFSFAVAQDDQEQDFLYGERGDDDLFGDGGDDHLDGGIGNDKLTGGLGDDALIGGQGIDILNGGSGKDTLYGGTGDDVLNGGSNDDIYQFRTGDGSDTITDSNIGTIEISGTIKSLIQEHNRAIIYHGNNDQIVLADNAIAGVKEILENGILVNILGHLNLLNDAPVMGSAGDDEVHLGNIGTATSVDTAAGNDTIRSAVSGSFSIKGGAGNDYIEVTAAGQTLNLSYNSGDSGEDNIRINGDSTAEHLLASREGDDLKLILKKTLTGPVNFSSATHISIEDYLLNQTQFGGVSFANGDTLSMADLITDLKTEGDDNNNHLTGHQGDDTFLGRKGDDALNGMGGNNTYIYRAGDGNDTIRNQGSSIDINTLVLQGIDPSETTLRRKLYSDHLLVQIADGSEIHISNHFYNSENTLDAITFDDGTRWQQSYIDNAVLLPSDYNDYIVGGESNDNLSGGKGRDTLKGQEGNDTLIGGSGDDSLNGGTGSDTYLYRAGDGNDFIDNYDATSGRHDSILFDNSIDKSGILVRREYSDLTLYWKTNKIVTVTDHFDSPESAINAITFADGSEYDQTTISHLVLGPSAVADTLTGTASADQLEGFAGNDTLYGRAGSDTLIGGADDDQLYGEAGEDRLQGSTGNDSIYGGNDSDTYLYDLNDGYDTISDSGGTADHILFGAGITQEQVLLRRDASHLSIWIDGVLSLTVSDHFASDTTTLEYIEFDNGTLLDQAAILTATKVGTDGQDVIYGDDQVNTLFGQGGDDELLGFAGNDTLTGGSGHDILRGGMGSDTYYFDLGYGIDTIIDKANDASSTDTLIFGSGINPDDIQVQHLAAKQGYPWEHDLILTNKHSGDQITLEGYFGSGSGETNHSIKKVQFTDGTVWTNSDFRNLSLIATETADELYHDGLSGKAINGLGGDDIIFGTEGDDIITGGSGNDSLSGRGGNDIYRYQRGDGFDSLKLELGDTLNLMDINPEEVWLHTTRTNSWSNETQTRISLKDGSGAIQLTGESGYLIFSDGTHWDLTAIEAAVVSSTPFDDFIMGSESNDTLTGRAGNDVISGGDGDDTYHFSRGDDNDTIIDSGGSNTLLFAANISADDVVVWRDIRADWPESYDLFIGIKGANQQIRIDGFYDRYSDQAATYQLIFEGSSSQTVTHDELLNTPDFSLNRYYQTLDLNLTGMPANSPAEWGDAWDYGIFVSAQDDTLFFHQGSIWAGEGDDFIVSSLGSESPEIDGGLGEDTIYAGGSDASIFGGPASTSGATTVHYYHNYWDYGGLAYPSRNNEYSYSTEHPLDGDDHLYAEGGNDTLHGGGGNDLLVGGHGNDLLSGGEGDDTYQFNIGDGQDRIITLEKSADVIVGSSDNRRQADFRNEFDLLQFGIRINPEDIIARQVGNHLQLTLQHTLDSVWVEQFFSTDRALSEAIKAIRFENGSQWNLNDIRNQAANVAQPTPTQTLVDHDPETTLAGDSENSILVGNSTDNTLIGESGNDALYGRNGNDQLLGGTGSDTLIGEAGKDHLVGGSGNDVLIGGNHSDTYLFSAGFGDDIIDNYDDTPKIKTTDAISFDASISKEDIKLTQMNDDLVLTHLGDKLIVKNHFLGVGFGFNPRYAIDVIQFADGTTWATQDISNIIYNHAPVVSNPIVDQSINEDAPFTFQVPAGTFIDPDTEESPSLSASLADGSPLPSWLNFDVVTNTFSGTPNNAEVGSFELRVTATDSLNTTVSDTFSIHISNINDTPMQMMPIADQTTTANAAFNFILPTDTFADIDIDDQLSLSATLADGTPLPGWLAFDSLTGTLSGTPDNTQTGILSIQIMATDTSGEAISDSFDLVISEDNTPTGNIIEGTSNNDSLIGSADDDTFLVEGTGQGYDNFWGDTGFDTIRGGVGDDDIGLRSFNPDDSIERIDGGWGTNTIVGDERVNWFNFSGVELHNIASINTGAGNDFVIGSAGDDTITGGTGNDWLMGGDGNDTFVVAGTDQGHDTFWGGAGIDTILGGTGDDTIGIRYLSSKNRIDRIDGGLGDNQVTGSNGRDRLDFSNTELLNIDSIDAGAGSDRIIGSAGDDLIFGGQGNDLIKGGAGNDTYRFAMGDGRDRIVNDDDAAESHDELNFSNLDYDDLWLSRTRGNLVIDVVGTRDKVTIADWYRRDDHQLDVITTNDHSLQQDQVAQLVNAMAAFDVPSGIGAVIPTEVKTELTPILSASWQ